VESGYESGCDDYIRKPFVLKELLLRIETLLRREFFHASNNLVKIAVNIDYDIQNGTLLVDGKTQPLSHKEVKLLKLFLQNKNTLLSHEQIFAELWEYDEEPSESALRTYIKNLRKYLGGEKIVSIKKLGYRFTAQ
jgi:DNA-binding response OmpR family regulator